MFFPYGDTPNPPNYRPWMTRALILANVAVYFLVTSPLSSVPLAQQFGSVSDEALRGFIAFVSDRVPIHLSDRILTEFSRYDFFVFTHGYQPGLPSFADLLSSLFLHANIWHLLGNMLFLWIFGDNVEHRLGRLGFLAAYLVSGISATLAFGLFAGGSMAPLIGASGAISGILGIYFVLFPKNRIKIFVFLFPFLVTRWYVPARIVLAIYLVVDNVLPFIIGSDSGVAYGAHLGGFGAGLLIGLAVAKINVKAIWQRIFPARRTVIREVPKTDRPDPRSVIIDAEYVDEN